MLPKSARLSRSEIAQVRSSGRRSHSAHLLAHRLGAQQSKYAITVSKKVAKNAVARNRLRRRLSALVHEVAPRLPNEHVVLVAKVGAEALSPEEMRHELLQVLR